MQIYDMYINLVLIHEIEMHILTYIIDIFFLITVERLRLQILFYILLLYKIFLKYFIGLLVCK